jgi:glycosyltransferase involved in cell wall biosynthesis
MEEMRDFYNSIDAYICASNLEGSNNSLLEAASMERAIITTDVGTVPEYLKNAESALIVQRDLQSFRQAAERLRDNPEKRLAMGKAARASVVKHWDWKTRAEDFRRFFREAINVATQTKSGETDSSLSKKNIAPCS